MLHPHVSDQGDAPKPAISGDSPTGGERPGRRYTTRYPFGSFRSNWDEQAEREANATPTRRTTPRSTVEAELAAHRRDGQERRLDEAGIRALLDSFGDVVGDVFADADPAELAQFYRSIGLMVSYDHDTRTAEASVTLTPPGLITVGGESGV